MNRVSEMVLMIRVMMLVSLFDLFLLLNWLRLKMMLLKLSVVRGIESILSGMVCVLLRFVIYFVFMVRVMIVIGRMMVNSVC